MFLTDYLDSTCENKRACPYLLDCPDFTVDSVPVQIFRATFRATTSRPRLHDDQ